MKSKVRYSVLSIIMTLVVIAALVAGLVFTPSDRTGFYMLVVGLLFIFGLSLWYAPLLVKVTDDGVVQCSALKQRLFPFQDIDYVHRCRPSMGAIRLCGSSGFMGNWGLYRQGDLGRYMAYYGHASECFMLRMKDGRNILLGCRNPEAVLALINERLKGTH